MLDRPKPEGKNADAGDARDAAGIATIMNYDRAIPAAELYGDSVHFSRKLIGLSRMSWDVRFVNADSSMGSKASVREQFLAACERILGTAIPRQGPTEVPIDHSFRFEALFIGNKHVTESLCLSIQVLDGAPHVDPSHPACKFIRRIAEETGWKAYDTYKDETIT